MNLAIEIEEGKVFPSFAVLYPDNTLKFRRTLYRVDNVSILTQENSKAMLGTVGGAALGSVVLGPIGLIAGALAGGNKNRTALIIECHGGPRLIGTVPAKYVPKIFAVVEKAKSIAQANCGPAGSSSKATRLLNSLNNKTGETLSVLFGAGFLLFGLMALLNKDLNAGILFLLVAVLVMPFTRKRLSTARDSFTSPTDSR
jgi:hypothetical protein